MRGWKVLLNGQNYLFESEGRKRKMGFYTTRFVEAETAEIAKSVAIMAVHELPKLRIVLNDPSDPPRVEAESVEPLDPSQPIERPTTGLVLYAEDGQPVLDQ
jgi:hypothetical protein